MARTSCADWKVACTDDSANATCSLVVSRSNSSRALAASCAWTSGGSDDEEKTVSEKGVALEPAGSVEPLGTTEA